MLALSILALVFVTLLAFGLAMMAFGDLPVRSRLRSGEGFDPYAAEARAYLLEQDPA